MKTIKPKAKPRLTKMDRRFKRLATSLRNECRSIGAKSFAADSERDSRLTSWLIVQQENADAIMTKADTVFRAVTELRSQVLRDMTAYINRDRETAAHGHEHRYGGVLGEDPRSLGDILLAFSSKLAELQYRMTPNPNSRDEQPY